MSNPAVERLRNARPEEFAQSAEEFGFEHRGTLEFDGEMLVVSPAWKLADEPEAADQQSFVHRLQDVQPGTWHIFALHYLYPEDRDSWDDFTEAIVQLACHEDAPVLDSLEKSELTHTITGGGAYWASFVEPGCVGEPSFHGTDFLRLEKPHVGDGFTMFAMPGDTSFPIYVAGGEKVQFVSLEPFSPEEREVLVENYGILDR